MTARGANLLRDHPGHVSGTSRPSPEQGPSTQITSQNECGEPCLQTRWPLEGNLGTLYMGYRVASVVGGPVHLVHKELALAGLISVLLALLVALVLSRRVAQPLRRTIALAQQMAEGDFSQRLGIRGSDEVGALARSFDSMADSLHNTLTDLHQEQAHLSSVLNSVAEGIMAVDVVGRVVMMNPQAAALLGLERGLGAAVSELGLPGAGGDGLLRLPRPSRNAALELDFIRPNRHLVLYISPVHAGETGHWGAVRGGAGRDRSAPPRADASAVPLRCLARNAHPPHLHRRLRLGHHGRHGRHGGGARALRLRHRARSGAAQPARERLARSSRIESGAVQLQREEVDLAELIRAAAESFETQTGDAGVALQVDLPEDSRACTPTPTVSIR